MTAACGLVALGVFMAAVPSHVAAQQAPPPDDRAATNVRDFDFVIDKITQNYAGWDTKVTPASKPALTALTERLRKKAAAASDAELAQILSEWIGFFKDGHTRVFTIAPAAPPAAATSAPVMAMTETQVRARLTALGNKRDPVEGIWRIGGDRYRVGVLRDGPAADRFTAVVLTTTADTWHPGETKATIVRSRNGTLAMTYFSGGHGKQEAAATLIAAGAAIGVGDTDAWVREVPRLPDSDLVARQVPSGELFLKQLSAQTLWLRIPDFDDGRAKPLADLLAQHRAEIDRFPNLVIDLRNNGGGSDFVYAPLLPFLYTKPIYSIGIELRVSADNIALRRAVADRIRAEAPGPAAELDTQIKQMVDAKGGYFQPDPAPFSVDRRASALPYPKRIAVLIDHAASTGEQFLLDARQSRKVTLFGQHNSAGILDFANVVGMDTPSGRFHVQWATSRSLQLPGDPVDPEGIAPDVRIPSAEADPVRYAQRWLERQVD